MSLSVASNWLWNFGIGYATPYLVNSGAGNANLQVKVFFVWGSTCFCCILFTYFCVPEVSSHFSLHWRVLTCFTSLQTKGLSLEQIDLMYQNTLPVNSLKYRARLLEEAQNEGKQETDHHEVASNDEKA